jgi:hypothetical protein
MFGTNAIRWEIIWHKCCRQEISLTTVQTRNKFGTHVRQEHIAVRQEKIWQSCSQTASKFDTNAVRQEIS